MSDPLHAAIQRAVTPDERALEKIRGQGKLTARERIDLLLDAGSFVEDGVLANAMASGLPADGVVTGRGTIEGMPAIVVANDPMVKAGSWGARTVEKMVRASEAALREQVPIVWLVDSAGARLTDQVQLFPGRRGAGHIFYNQVRLSGQVPQICCLFGPSAAGGAYIPSFCDVVFMVDGNASMYLGSPRMAEMVVGEITTLEEMGGARMHVSQSGCADNLAADDEDAIEQAKAYLTYFPRSWKEQPAVYEAEPPAVELTADTVPADERVPFDMHDVIDGIVDRDSFFEVKPLFARELIVGLGRLDGHPVGIVANNSAHLAGTLFVDSADKAARFIWCCDAFNIPLVFLADVPGFMIGSAVERQGIIRHGAKMVTAVSEATVAKVSVDRPQGVRRRALRDVRPGVRAGGDDRPTDRPHRRDGPGGGDQRRVREQDRRDRRSGRARRVRRRAAGDLRDRRRSVAFGVGARDRRHHRARRAARRADRPHRARPPQGPPLRRPPSRHPTGLTRRLRGRRRNAAGGSPEGRAPSVEPHNAAGRSRWRAATGTTGGGSSSRRRRDGLQGGDRAIGRATARPGALAAVAGESTATASQQRHTVSTGWGTLCKLVRSLEDSFGSHGGSSSAETWR